MFAVVKFPKDNDATAVIPTNWMIGDKKLYWCESVRHETAVKTRENPNPEWPVYPCSVLRYFDTHEDARKGLVKSVATSDLSESDEGQKRKRNVNVLYDYSLADEDAEDELSQFKKKSPKIDVSTPPYRAASNFVKLEVPTPPYRAGKVYILDFQCVRDDESSQSHQQKCNSQPSSSNSPVTASLSAESKHCGSEVVSRIRGDVNAEYCSEVADSQGKRNVGHVGLQSMTYSIATVGHQYTQTDSYLSDGLDGGFKSFVITKFAQIKSVLDNVHTLILAGELRSSDVQHKAHDDVGEWIGFQFPIKTVADWKHFDESLANKDISSNLLAFLKSIGGTSERDTVTRILKEIIAYEVASNYSWKGGKKKSKFEEFNINKLIFQAVRSHKKKKVSEATKADVHSSIQQYLVHSPCRMKQRLRKINSEHLLHPEDELPEDENEDQSSGTEGSD